MMQKRVVLVMLTIFIVVGSCKKIEKQSVITPPIPDLNPEYLSFTFQALEGDTIELPRNGQLIIPPKALLNSDGSSTSGEVTIEYREFNNALDIFLAGIPMEFEYNGRTKNMITSGMFEIRAYQETSQLTINPKYPLEVTYGSVAKGSDYNFFALDEYSGDWQFVDAPVNIANSEIEEIENTITELTPKYPFPLKPNYFVLDYNSIIDVFADLSGKWNGGEKGLSKAEKYGVEWSSIYSYEEIRYYGNYRPASLMLWKRISGASIPGAKKNYNSRLKQISGNKYKLVLYRSNDWDFKKPIKSMVVEAIMPLTSLFKHKPSYWENNYAQAMESIRIEEEKLAKQAKVFRSIELYEFGYFNFDILMKLDESITVNASFTVDNAETTDDLNIIKCMTGDNRSLIDLKQDRQIWLDPTDTNYRIFSITKDLEFAMFPLDEYQSINFDSIGSIDKPEMNFELKILADKIESREQLMELLNWVQ